jgi:3-oxocholest-4-en-26-oate---CoA ligase
MTRTYNLADLFEIVVDAAPDRLALITGEGTYTYAQLDERATRLANHLVSIGISRGEHVGIHATNCAEWVEAFYACCKISAVAVNVNFRYVEAELTYLYGNSNCVLTIVAPEFSDVVSAAAPNLRQLVLDDEYEAALAAAPTERPNNGRSSDDLYVLYTGGTTGMPKGVMWRHEDVFFAAMNSSRGNRPLATPEDLGVEIAALPAQMRLLALGPMMHGGGQWVMGNALMAGNVFVLWTGKRFDPHAIWKFVAESGSNTVSTIGDAMARPLAEALLKGGRRHPDLSSVWAIGNGGAPLSARVREQLREALPNVAIMDSYGASETGANGSKLDEGEGLPSPRFQMGEHTTVLRDDGTQAEVGEVGKLARSGYIPLGYYNDPGKTAATFPTYANQRWVIPGDFARIEADGAITLLGRGSVSINTGGEKVFPEEVEAALKAHPAVFDVVVVGITDARWGERVTALVQLRPDVPEPTDAELGSHCRTLIADFKIPKRVLRVPEVQRTPVGKADYQWAKITAQMLS